MDELRIGDAVNTTILSGSTAYPTRSDELFLSHAQNTSAPASNLYLTLKTSTRQALTLGPAQDLPLNGLLAAAHAAALGDEVTLADGRRAVVTNIAAARRRSRYGLHVAAAGGLLAVDGVLASGWAADDAPALTAVEAAYRACSARICRRVLGSAAVRGAWEALASLSPLRGDVLLGRL